MDLFQPITSCETDSQIVFIGENKNLKKKKKKKMKKIKYKIDGKKIVFNKKTMDYYCTMRKVGVDPITCEKISDIFAFKVDYMWDPYTGERLQTDPFGPLSFDPITLVYYFYTIRTKKLWMNDVGDKTGYFQGTYDDAVGIGDDFPIPGRGNYREWYIFRLPISDCYLQENYSRQIVTMGPKLTYEDICKIDDLADKIGEYKFRYRKKKPSLKEIWKYYHIAISKTPHIPNGEYLSKLELQNAREALNRAAVDILREM